MSLHGNNDHRFAWFSFRMVYYGLFLLCYCSFAQQGGLVVAISEAGPRRFELSGFDVAVVRQRNTNVGNDNAYDERRLLRGAVEELVQNYFFEHNWGEYTTLIFVGLAGSGPITATTTTTTADDGTTTETEADVFPINGGVVDFGPNSIELPDKKDLDDLVKMALTEEALTTELKKIFPDLTSAFVVDLDADEPGSDGGGTGNNGQTPQVGSSPDVVPDDSAVAARAADGTSGGDNSKIGLIAGTAGAGIVLVSLIVVLVERQRRRRALWRDDVVREFKPEDTENGPEKTNSRGGPLPPGGNSSDAGSSSRLGRLFAATAAAVPGLPAPPRSASCTPPGSSDAGNSTAFELELVSDMDGTLSVEPSVVPMYPMESFEHHKHHRNAIKKDMMMSSTHDNARSFLNHHGSKKQQPQDMNTCVLKPTDMSAAALVECASWSDSSAHQIMPANDGGFMSDDNLTFEPDEMWDPDDDTLGDLDEESVMKTAFDTPETEPPTDDEHLLEKGRKQSYNLAQIKSPDFQPRKLSFPGVL